MSIIGGADHLTVANPAQAVQQSQTVPGMMTWAGTGDQSQSCAGCIAFRKKRKAVDQSKDEPREGRCLKYIRFMRARDGAAPIFWIPPQTSACRYFEPRKAK